jgi:3-oxoacyl-[acyl-carrier protein] reductase
MDLGLRDRVALVTGASSGLGLAAATELAREGCRVALCSRTRERIDRAADALARGTGVALDRLLPLTCDVTREEDVRRTVEATVERFGTLNVLVTNAGGPPSGQVDDFDAEAWHAALELNLMSTINLCRHALPHLRRAASEQDGLARIIMITSLAARQPVPTLYLSNVARAGVQGFAKSLSEELGPAGITVNTILPGYTRTPRLVELATSLEERTGRSTREIEAGWASGSALKRIGREDEFAAAVAFLAGSRASYITGVALPVDGGAIKSLF